MSNAKATATLPKVSNIRAHENKNGTTSLTYTRTFRRQKLRLFISQNPQATVKEKFDQLLKINRMVDAVAWLAHSRESMMDIIMKHRYVSIRGEVGRNAQLVLMMKGRRRSWALNQYGETKATNLCIATMLTLIGVESEANRVILGAVLRHRIMNLINDNRYRVVNRTIYRGLPELRKALRTLYSQMRQDKYKMQKKSHVIDQAVSAYVKLEYRMLLVPKDGKYEGVLQKCLVLDSINVDEDHQKQGWFTSLVNECIKFMTIRDIDALCIDNVISPELQTALRKRTKIWHEEPETTDGKRNDFCPRFVYFKDRDTSVGLSEQRCRETNRLKM